MLRNLLYNVLVLKPCETTSMQLIQSQDFYINFIYIVLFVLLLLVKNRVIVGLQKSYTYWDLAIDYLINNIDTKAKCRHLKKWVCKGTLRQVFICWGPKPHTPPPLHMIYVYTFTCTQYNFSYREGGRVEPERRGKGQQKRVQIPKLGWNYQFDWMYTRNWL